MTIDKTRLPARRGALPAFTPVPRTRARTRARALHNAFRAAEEEDRLAREAAKEAEERAWRESEGEDG